MGNKVSKAFKKFGKDIGNLANDTSDAFKKMGNDIKNTTDKVTKQIGDTSNLVVTATGDGLNGAVMNIDTFSKNLSTSISSYANGVSTQIAADFMNSIDIITSPDFQAWLVTVASAAAIYDKTGVVALGIAMGIFAKSVIEYNNTKNDGTLTNLIVSSVNLIICASACAFPANAVENKLAIVLLKIVFPLCGIAGSGLVLGLAIKAYCDNKNDTTRKDLSRACLDFVVSLVGAKVSASGGAASLTKNDDILAPPTKITNDSGISYYSGGLDVLQNNYNDLVKLYNTLISTSNPSSNIPEDESHIDLKNYLELVPVDMYDTLNEKYIALKTKYNDLKLKYDANKNTITSVTVYDLIPTQTTLTNEKNNNIVTHNNNRLKIFTLVCAIAGALLAYQNIHYQV